MTEFGGFKNYDIQPADKRRVDEIALMIAKKENQLQARDPVESAFFISLLPELATDGRVRPHLEETFALRRSMDSFFPTGYALRTLEFSVDKQVREMFPDYPEYFVTPAWWFHKDVFGKLDYHVLHEDMRHNLQSNMSNAYAIYHLLSHAYKDRFSGTPTALDSGVSLGLGLKKWLSPTESFAPIQVIKPPRKGQPIVPGGMEPDTEAQEIVNYLNDLDPSIDHALGYDTMPVNPDDEDAIKRVFSHTFPMSESIHRSGEVSEFNRLAYEGNHKIKIMRDFIDATDEYMLTKLEDQLPGGEADLGIYSAVFFQHPPEAIGDILNNTTSYFSEYAPRFITDFAVANSNAPNGLEFIRGDWWHRPGSFATFVIDPLNGPAPVELARFSTRRGEEMWLTEEGRALLKKAAGLNLP